MAGTDLTDNLDAATVHAACQRLSLLVITPLGRSGSMLMQSLFDGHPEVACLSEVGQDWNHSKSFDSTGHDISIWLDRHPDFCDGHNFAGADSEAGLAMRAWFPGKRTVFEHAFRSVWQHVGTEDMGEGRRFWVSIAIAWAVARGQNIGALKYLVFQHHNHRGIAGDMPAMLNDFPDLRVLATCRHPIESGLSFQTLDRRTGQASFRNFSRNVRGWSSACWRHLQAAIADLDHAAQVRLIDLNALHADPEAVLRRLANWLQIEDHSALRQSTMLGVNWGGNSADGRPIPTFDAARSRLLYPGTVGSEKGLSPDEYRFAEWLTRQSRSQAGYDDTENTSPAGALGFLWIMVRRMDWFRADVIAHDRGLKKLLRRMGAVEIGLVLKEVMSQKKVAAMPLAHLRLDAMKDSDD